MIFCILVLYLPPGVTADARSSPAQTPAPPAPLPQHPGGSGDPDALYARREELPSARAAERTWSERRASGGEAGFEAAWKQARADYWLGTHEATKDERRAALERGLEAARAAIKAQPRRPDGHFWLAANMGALAESFGLRMGLRYRGDIKRELEVVLKIDPGYQLGSADRALGRWYYRVPGLFGGSKKKSEEHLRRSLAYQPTSHASLFFLAETLLAMDRDEEARAVLEKLIAAPAHPDWEPEDKEFKEKGKRLIESMKN
jgi:hypothetical protein